MNDRDSDGSANPSFTNHEVPPVADPLQHDSSVVPKTEDGTPNATGGSTTQPQAAMNAVEREAAERAAEREAKREAAERKAAAKQRKSRERRMVRSNVAKFTKRHWVVLCAPILFVAALALATQWDPPQSVANAGMRIDFNYGRESISRSRTIPLCGFPNATTRFAECRPDFEVGSQRPAIMGVAWASDFTPTDEKKELCTSVPGSVFPASQVDVSATNFDPNGIALLVKAEPTKPEEVAPGSYCSVALITREGEKDPIEYQVVIDLRDRFELPIVYRVGLALFFGAVIGALLKWIADNVGKQTQPIPAVPQNTGALRSWLGSHASLTIGLATAAGVAILGSQSQFIGDSTFNDGFLDYLTLFIWAFVGQLAGQTLADVVGNTRVAAAGHTDIGTKQPMPDSASQLPDDDIDSKTDEDGSPGRA